jgi:Tc toxin complex TcA C-terminal TcB-binding domain
MGSSPPYVVIRLVPESPVDGATFATYLDGLALQLIDANTLQPRSDLAYSSPLILFEWPGASGWMSLVSVPTSEPTSYNGSDYGNTLKFDSTDGIPVGSVVYSTDQTTIPVGSLQVMSVTQSSVQLSGTLSKYVPVGTVVSFIGQSPSGDPTSAPTNFSFILSTSSPATTLGNDLVVLHLADTTGIEVGIEVSGSGVASGTTVAYVDTGAGTVTISQPLTSSPSSVTFTLNPPFAYFTVKPSSGTPAAKPSTLKFPSNATNGIAVGMTLVPVTGLIAPGTTVTSVTATTVKLSQPLLGPLPSGQKVTFTFPLSNGIVQHVEVTTTIWNFFTGFEFAIIPAAVATAVVPLNPTPPRPDYLDIKVKATRGAEILPLPDTFYNVRVNSSALPQQAYQYQAISPADTSLYVSLPPLPGANSISLTIPSDGSAPPFDALYPAIQAALQNDPVPGVSSPADLISSAASCKRIAYDIIWSYQNSLPLPPDPLESLYSNPPNPGGGGSITNTSGGSNNFEQDRQKFEGELGSFYSTNNANAERLTKFVAAASAAVACEQASLNSGSALLEFPVDPSVSYANEVESELLVQGVSVTGPGGLNFGVPAAFFYALGAHLDQSTGTVQRFQMATGDAIERLLQQLGTAVDQGVISDTEDFSDTSVFPVSVTSFQAARRLAALGVSAASTSPSVTVYAGTPLASLIRDWLQATVPAPQNPPLTYDNTDFNIWTQLAVKDQTDEAGYLYLDLDALTQGYVIPAIAASPGAAVASGPVLTFPSGLGIGPGMPVSGTNITPGTTVLSVTPATQQTVTVTLSAAILGAIPVTQTLTFNDAAPLNSTLAEQIAAWLPTTTNPATPNPTVATLKQVTASQWTAFFTAYGSPTWLPPFTQPVAPGASPSPAPPTAGYIALRIRAFIRAVHQFFTVSSVATSAQLPAAGTPPTFERPAFDPIGQAVADLPGTFEFGDPLSSADLTADVQTVFGTDLAAQAWLTQAMTAINELWQVARVVPDPAVTAGSSLPAPVSFAFSVMEALYARGFASAQDIVNRPGPDFQQALTGTVAYDFASSLYAQAQTLAPASPAKGAPGGTFRPVNPDGSLVNCVPPPCLSPSGPIAYLQEMLGLSELSTCDAVLAAPLSLTTTADAPAGTTSLTFTSTAGAAAGMSASADGIPAGTTVTATTTASVTLSGAVSTDVPAGSSVAFSRPTLSDVLRQRRGPVGELAASCANLDTPLPLIDIVNECLEYMAAAAPATSGTVYDTTASELPSDDQARLLGVMPEYSTPATPVAANAAVEPAAFNNLKTDFSSCLLPYSQALDVSRSYLRALGSSRFEEMRTFRRCITEFVLDPANEPAGFHDWLWRYPVRVDIAWEYLGITPEEYSMLFGGNPVPPCAMPEGVEPASGGAAPASLAWAAREDPVGLPAFLAETCLSYCEFYELWQSGFVTFRNRSTQQGDGQEDGSFPECEPCCPDDLWLEFGEGQQQSLTDLLVFVRLWRTLRDLPCGGYSFAQLRDICDVLQLTSGGALNSDFVRQLAAFQMLREEFGMELSDPEGHVPPGAVDAERTQLLALWAEQPATAWPWAVRQLIGRVERYAQRRHRGGRRSPEFVKLLVSNLDPISQLAGFDPASATDSWHARPTHTLRFAEVLAKVYASDFSVGELLYLFTAGPHLDGDDPFPLQASNDALDFPLGLPDEEREHGLWRLRADMLAVEVSEEEDEEWPWRRIDAALQKEFGFALSDTLALAQHFFPHVLTQSGQQASPASALFVTSLATDATSASTWNDPPDGPFSYDPSGPQLSTRVPLSDRVVIETLTHAPDLSPAEQQAVQDLYFQPRAMLADFALLFDDFATAHRRLVEEPHEQERFRYFRHQFLLCHRRCAVIAEHLSGHVAAVTGRPVADGRELAALIVRSLAADENRDVGNWESDDGAMPALTWPVPAGGALAALLGLTGTGLPVVYQQAGGTTVWRDTTGPMNGFGTVRDRENCPVPTVVPSLAATLSPQDLQFASVHNGLLMKDATGAWLGGAQGFTAAWAGALLVDRAGTYEFWAGAPTPGDERPDPQAAGPGQWRVVLSRGQRTWVLLSHHWAGEEEHQASALPLKAGAYHLRAEFTQPAPEFSDDEQARPQHTGFQVKYSGPDSGGCRTEIPHSSLFAVSKDGTLGDGIEGLSNGASAYLSGLYVSSLRDIRRTYQRAFKALLFAGRFRLSAHRELHGTSELGYLLSQATLFAGTGYYRSGSGFTGHDADLDFDFLPVADTYHPPAADARTGPSPQRVQAMFDWWERLHDYTLARAEVHERCQRHLWHLFSEAEEKQPADPTPLLRHLGADARDWPLELRYFQGQDVPAYAVTSADLADERWTLRAWHADRWLRAAQHHFASADVTAARPDLWASDDPSAALPGETQTGNENLVAFVSDGCLANGRPRGQDDLRRLDDGLRERGRAALVAYLCHGHRVALPWQPGAYAATAGDLGDLLLLDVEAGVREKASRIDEAITAAQSFVGRARIGLEPGWRVTGQFARLWDTRFATYRTWERCKRRELYRENWIEWDERSKARRIEAFRFLESGLRSSTLTLAAPGGLDWWADDDKALEREPELLQRRVPAELHQLSAPPESATREGLGTLGRPERATTPTWLTPVPQGSGSTGSTGVPSPADAAPRSGATAQDLVQAAVRGSAAPQSPPLWMESATKLGTRFVRVAAAGVPWAALGLTPHGDEPRSTCCDECGCEHPTGMDEYYFWLISTHFYAYNNQTDAQDGGDASFTGSYQFGYQDSYYDQYQQQSAEWDDEDQVPSLRAKWQPSPAVRLAWCRVHNGQFGQPRTSAGCVAVAGEPDLVFLGRAGDSLYFQVSGSAPLPAGYGADTSPPGFRYDLPPDDAVALPQVLAPPPPPATSPYPGGLPAYPFFGYFDPGARLFPASWFATALAVAEALRGDCAFERALRWYQRAFDPLKQDCAWVHCADDSDQRSTASPGRACCDSTVVTEQGARDRAVLLHYCETMLDWGDALMRRRRSPEAFQQARLAYGTVARIMGKRATTIQAEEPGTAPSVTNFVPAYAPLNPRLMDVYDKVADRLALVRTCQDGQRIRNGELGQDMDYFGDSPFVDGWRTAPQACADEQDWCGRPSPYRFLFQIQKAIELAGKLRELESALLSAYEKRDGEYLTAVHARQEREMLTLGIAIRQDQWRDADWQVQALQQTKDVSQTNLLYYANLYRAGLINDEIQNLDLTTSALQIRSDANKAEAAGEIMNIIPDSFFGAMSSGESPPIGTKIAHFFEAVAKIMAMEADIKGTTAAMDSTEASWQRRSDEWFHQMQVLPIEIQQTELQILGAQRRRDQALQELNNAQRQVEHATEVLDFLRDKFTATDLYVWLRKETAALHAQMYDLAHRAALEAQRAYNFERGHTTRRFIPEETWDTLHDGLLAGERLEGALHTMEKAYLDENRREYELTKHFSLRLQFPMAYLGLRIAGACQIDIPEWMFDLDYPGQYMRRIKDATITLACVTGPYTTINGQLTLLSSMTRIHPEVRPPAHRCCCDGERGSEYEACTDDPRIVREYAARESIATSSGQNDSGMFELNFRDERYLPFEYQGAVSRWRLELPPENNYFDLDTVSDVVLHLNYTAREGGDLLRAAAGDDARRRLPGDGLRLFDIRHDFPGAWPAAWRPGAEDREAEPDRRHRSLRLGLTPAMFPFVPGRRVGTVDRVLLMFEAPDAQPGHHHVVRFWWRDEGHDRATEFTAVADGTWPGYFCGMADLSESPLGPLRDARPALCGFDFPAQAGEIGNVFVIIRYTAENWPRCGPPTPGQG